MKIEPNLDISLKNEVKEENQNFSEIGTLSQKISSLSLDTKETVSLCDQLLIKVKPEIKDDENSSCIERGPDFNSKNRRASRQHFPYNISPQSNNSSFLECNSFNDNGNYNISNQDLPSSINWITNNPQSSQSSQLLLSGGTALSNVANDEIVQFLKEPLEERAFIIDPEIAAPTSTDPDEENALDFILDFEGAKPNFSELCNTAESNSGELNFAELCYTPESTSGRNSVTSDLGNSLSPVSFSNSPGDHPFDESDSGIEEEFIRKFSMLNQDPVQSETLVIIPKIAIKSTLNRTSPESIVIPNPNGKPPGTLKAIRPKGDLLPVTIQHQVADPSLQAVTGTAKKQQAKRSKSFKDDFLDEIPKDCKDKYHKQILRLANKPGGLGIIDAAGHNYLHLYILRKNNQQAVYFIHILSIWKSKYKDVLDIQKLINARDNDGRTPLFYTSIQKMDRMVRILLECGANPNIPEVLTGDTPLHWASQRGLAFKDVVAALSKFPNIDLNCSNLKGQRPLHQAVENHLKRHLDENLNKYEVINSRPTIELLLRAGASLAVKDNNGKTPLHYAVKTGNKDIIDWLHLYSRDINEAINLRDVNGETVLHEAMKLSLPTPEIKTIILEKLVIDCGADPDIVDNNGLKPGYYKDPTFS